MPSLTAVTSASDPRLDEYRAVSAPALALERGCFVAEGRLIVERLIREGRCRVRSVLVTPTANAAMAPVFALLPDAVPVYVAEQAVMASTAGFDIHRGCVAIADRPAPVPESTLDVARTLVVLERCGNVDNMGGMFRSAAAFDVDAIVLSPGCCDPLYRKAVRTSMGAALSVPFVQLTAWPGALGNLKSKGFTIVATTPHASAATVDEAFAAERQARVAVLAGTEGGGLTADVMAAADLSVRIPTSSRVDSLNVVVAVSIVLARLAASPVSGKT